MEVFLPIAGFLYVAVLGYLAMLRFGRFFDNGGIAPYPEEDDPTDAPETQRRCSPSDPNRTE